MVNSKLRTQIVFGLLYILIGLFFLLIKEEFIYLLFNKYPGSLIPLSYTIACFTSILLGITVFIRLYIKGVIIPNTKSSGIEYTSSYIENQLADFKAEILNRLSKDDDTGTLKDFVQEQVDLSIKKISEEKIISELSQKFEAELADKGKLRLIENNLLNIIHSVERDAARVSRYGTINLSIGFITTALAIFILTIALFNNEVRSPDITIYLLALIPRVSLSILIELFSFFFLRLYKRNLEDIKYYNTEKTNIEVKMIAVKMALVHVNEETIKNVITELLRTERNYILKKGESTIDIKKNQIEAENNSTLLEILSKLVDKRL